MRFKKRGQTTVPAAVAIGVDPITFAIGTSKLAALGEDELELSGGIRNRPVELVKCETSDLMVPAHAEIILEGEISVTEMEEEGPYGEVYGLDFEDMRRRVPDLTEIQELISYEPKFSIEDIILDVAAHERQRLERSLV